MILTMVEEVITMREAVDTKMGGSEKSAGRFCTIGDPLQAPPCLLYPMDPI